jgi:hypothetical protein
MLDIRTNQPTNDRIDIKTTSQPKTTRPTRGVYLFQQIAILPTKQELT